MDRRSFFKSMVGGVAVAAAVRTWPYRVFSFPTEIIPATLPATSIRFIKAYDVMQDKMISRFDVLYGWGHELLLPRGVDTASSITAKGNEPLSLETIQAFALRHAQGKLPLDLIAQKIPNKEQGWVQKGWDIS